MARPEAEHDLGRELSELRARVQQLTDRAALAERDAVRYRLLLEHLNVGVFVSSLEGRMLECNDRTVQMSGETRESLLTKSLATHYEDPSDRARLVAELQSTGAVRNFETWTRQPSGKRVAASMNAVLAPIGSDGAKQILGMLEDITDRKLAEERASESEERFRVIAEQSMLGILIFQDDAIPFVNQAVSDIKSEGSGVGLTATYAILRKHDGHIEAESQAGNGATFHVWLPAVSEQAEGAEPAPRKLESGRGLVLVMDDDDMVRQVTGSMLAHIGYEAIATCDGSEALERTKALLAEGKHLYAAMLDLTVRSGKGGRDTVRPLRELMPQLPIIASSGYSDDPVMSDPALFGFTASLHKPFLLTELADLLARLVAR